MTYTSALKVFRNTSVRLLAASVAFACASAQTAAQEATTQHSLCVDLGIPKDLITAHDGRWTELTNDQRLFLAGIYAMHPLTPKGLPYGDRAVLAQANGDKGGLVFFVDGNLACTPMAVPAELVQMLFEVGSGSIRHEVVGSGT